MKVTAIETIRLEAFPNLLWVQVHSDRGLAGLGEATSLRDRGRQPRLKPAAW